jgi:AcrR family transcriptional regulator
MARPLSEEKRDAILSAATDAVAALGIGAATAKIAKAAGVAEGTLFTYFPTKDDLLNALYLAIKEDLHQSLMADYPAAGDLRERIRHVWDRFIDWSLGEPAKSKAMRQLAVSERISETSRRLGSAPFSNIEALLAESVAKGALSEQPIAFAGAVMQALTDTVAQFIQQEPGSSDRYKQAGFNAFWNAIAKP